VDRVLATAWTTKLLNYRRATTAADAYEIPTAANDSKAAAGPSHGTDAPIERKLTQLAVCLQPLGTHVAVRGQHRGGQGHVKEPNSAVLFSLLVARAYWTGSFSTRLW
jgi:hypothetical protein